MATINPIDAAISFANGKEHDGAGFTLILHFNNGQSVEVDAYPDHCAGPVPHLLTRREATALSDGNPIYPNVDAISFVEVCW